MNLDDALQLALQTAKSKGADDCDVLYTSSKAKIWRSLRES